MGLFRITLSSRYERLGLTILNRKDVMLGPNVAGLNAKGLNMLM